MALSELRRVQLELDEEYYDLKRMQTIPKEELYQMRVIWDNVRAILNMDPLYQEKKGCRYVDRRKHKKETAKAGNMVYRKTRPVLPTVDRAW